MKRYLLARAESGVFVVADPVAVPMLATAAFDKSAATKLNLDAEILEGNTFVVRLPMDSAEWQFRLFVNETSPWDMLPSSRESLLVEDRLLRVPSGALCFAGTDNYSSVCNDTDYSGRLEIEPGNYLLSCCLQNWSVDEWDSYQEEFLTNSVSRSARRVGNAVEGTFSCILAATIFLLPLVLVGAYWWDGWLAVWSSLKWLAPFYAVVVSVVGLLRLNPPMRHLRAARRRFRELFHSGTDLTITMRRLPETADVTELQGGSGLSQLPSTNKPQLELPRDLRENLAGHGSHVPDELLAWFQQRLVRGFSINSVRVADDLPLSRRASKIGGNPYLGEESDWPRDKDGDPLYFLMQVNFAELFEPLEPLPRAGILVVYAYKELTEVPPCECRWYPNPRAKPSGTSPAGSASAARYECRLRFRPRWFLPELDESWRSVPGGEEHRYAVIDWLGEFNQRQQGTDEAHELLGAGSSPLSEEIEFHKLDPYELRVLLKIDSDQAANFGWGSNTVYVIIDEKHLREGALDFARAVVANC